ncbi:hypothetical protein CCYA_CCYA08G2288 [Cyanidiococcus yangmingshanensis]|nr:hypothetical protein CCYA_CCYA08G2288 [Cyanidiococcus yangmingshanensis]
MVKAGLYHLPCTVAYDGPVGARSLAYWVVRATAADTQRQADAERTEWEASFRGRRLCGQQFSLEARANSETVTTSSVRPQFVVVGPSVQPDAEGWQPLTVMDAISTATFFGWDDQSRQVMALDQVLQRWEALAALAAPTEAEKAYEAALHLERQGDSDASTGLL